MDICMYPWGEYDAPPHPLTPPITHPTPIQPTQQGGALLDGFAHLLPGVSALDLGPAFGPLAFTLAMGTLFTLCNQRALESTNNAVVTGVVASFAALLFAGMQTVDPALFTHFDVGRLQVWDGMG